MNTPLPGVHGISGEGLKATRKTSFSCAAFCPACAALRFNQSISEAQANSCCDLVTIEINRERLIGKDRIVEIEIAVVGKAILQLYISV